MPIRIHELLLGLAGRLDDDALADARQMLASAELDRSLEFVAGCLVAGGVTLSGPQRAELDELFASTFLDPSVIERVPVRDDAPAYRHRFAIGAVEGTEPDHGVADAVRPVLDVLPDVRSVWCVWRLTPAGPVSGPVPHRVVLVGVGPGGFAPATAYRVEYALRRAGVRASVEVLVDGGQPTPYHQEAMRCARQVPFDDGPGGGGGRPLSPAESVPVETFAAEAPKTKQPARARAATAPVAEVTREDGPAPTAALAALAAPAFAAPALTEPALTEPAFTEPAFTEPAFTAPAEPAAPVLAAPVTAPAEVAAPVAAVPVVAAPADAGDVGLGHAQHPAGDPLVAGGAVFAEPAPPVAAPAEAAVPVAAPAEAAVFAEAGAPVASAPAVAPVASASASAEAAHAVAPVVAASVEAAVPFVAAPAAAALPVVAAPTDAVAPVVAAPAAAAMPHVAAPTDAAGPVVAASVEAALPHVAARADAVVPVVATSAGAALPHVAASADAVAPVASAEAAVPFVAAPAVAAEPVFAAPAEVVAEVVAPVAAVPVAEGGFVPVAVSVRGEPGVTPAAALVEDRVGDGAALERSAPAIPVAAVAVSADGPAVLPEADAPAGTPFARVAPVQPDVPAVVDTDPALAQVVDAGSVIPVADAAPALAAVRPVIDAGPALSAVEPVALDAVPAVGQDGPGGEVAPAASAETTTVMPAVSLEPVPPAQPAATAEPVPMPEPMPEPEPVAVRQPEPKLPSPFGVEPPTIDSVRAVPPATELPVRQPRPRPVESIKSVFEQEGVDRPSPRRRKRAQDDAPARPRLVPAPAPVDDTPSDGHAAALIDDMLNTQERHLLRELQDELARREKQDSQSGPWRSGRHGKPGSPFEPGQAPRHDRGRGSA